jgi:hypothetical protein
MKHINTFENFVNEAAVYADFTSQEKSAWRHSSNPYGDSYFMPKTEEEYTKMMKFLASKGWSFWNVNRFGGQEPVNADKLPKWKKDLAFKLNLGGKTVMPTIVGPTTQGAPFDHEKFFKMTGM